MIRTAANSIDLTRGRTVVQLRAGDEFDFTESEIVMLTGQKALRPLPGEAAAPAFDPWPTPVAQAVTEDE
jgi:hypothetical protein